MPLILRWPFFDVANHVVTSAGGIINNNASIDVADALQAILENGVEDMGIGELVLGVETMIVSLCRIISVTIYVILYGRMIEIYPFMYLFYLSHLLPLPTGNGEALGTIM